MILTVCTFTLGGSWVHSNRQYGTSDRLALLQPIFLFLSLLGDVLLPAQPRSPSLLSEAFLIPIWRANWRFYRTAQRDLPLLYEYNYAQEWMLLVDTPSKWSLIRKVASIYRRSLVKQQFLSLCRVVLNVITPLAGRQIVIELEAQERHKPFMLLLVFFLFVANIGDALLQNALKQSEWAVLVPLRSVLMMSVISKALHLPVWEQDAGKLTGLVASDAANANRIVLESSTIFPRLPLLLIIYGYILYQTVGPAVLGTLVAVFIWLCLRVWFKKLQDKAADHEREKRNERLSLTSALLAGLRNAKLTNLVSHRFFHQVIRWKS